MEKAKGMEELREMFDTLKKAISLTWTAFIWISLKSIQIAKICLKQIADLQEDLTQVKNLRQEKAE